MSCHDHQNHEPLTVLTVGNPAPGFTAAAYHNGDISKKISLSDYQGKWVLLFFYPLDFTFVCPTELIELGEKSNKFKEIGCEIIGASVDSIHSHKAWAQSDSKIQKIDFPIISDLTKEISYNYNILHPDGMSLRGAFIIDPEGVLQSIIVNNLPVGRNIDEILRTVTAFQTGELCQVGWKKGEKTIGKA